MRADHSGLGLQFGPERAISLLIMPHTVSLRHLGAVCLTVLVVGVLLTGRTAQAFINLILVVRHRWVAAAQRRIVVTLGDTSCSRTPVRWDDGATIQLSQNLS